MTPQEVRKTISRHEGISVELKECTQGIHPSVYESVCAFLNRLGGTIIMGISDKGEILDIRRKIIIGSEKSNVIMVCGCSKLQVIKMSIRIWNKRNAMIKNDVLLFYQ